MHHHPRNSNTFQADDIPSDIITPILEQLHDRRDLSQCALVNWAFHHATIPILYRTIDSRIRTGVNRMERRIVHPSIILLKKPEYIKYVHQVREQGTVGAFEPELVPKCREVLRLCVNLRSFRWVDNGHDTSNDADLLVYLDIIQNLPSVDELIIQTSSGISDEVWDKLTQLTSLKKVAIWCLHGKPRVLQGWSEKLGNTLTHLELGVSFLSRQNPLYCTSVFPDYSSLPIPPAHVWLWWFFSF